MVSCIPVDLHIVLDGSVGVDIAIALPLPGAIRLAQERQRAGACHVELLHISSSADKDDMRRGIIGQRVDGRLDGLEMSPMVGLADK